MPDDDYPTFGGQTLDERRAEQNKRHLERQKKWHFQAVEVVCELCLTGNHKACVRPCACGGSKHER